MFNIGIQRARIRLKNNIEVDLRIMMGEYGLALSGSG
jgi:hypothetical protein